MATYGFLNGDSEVLPSEWNLENASLSKGYRFAITRRMSIPPSLTYDSAALQAFEASFRGDVKRHTLVAQRRAFGSYLTIEFKKDEDSLNTAYYQVAVASTISLYNRYLLKAAALKATQREWSEEHKNQMRHFSITFSLEHMYCHKKVVNTKIM